MTTIHLLTMTNVSQLSEFCAIMIPCIWAGGLKRQATTKRHHVFKLFVQKVLKATQISCTCMILALHYIQRLRTAYPSLRASIGSEVRLFTTALVLANKYLDDNTFTNKTWSQVSSIPVNELNIMEMEFLSALNYTIHVPHTQFFEWANTCQQWYNKTCGGDSSQVVPQSSLKRCHDEEEQPTYNNNKKRFIDVVPPITPVLTQQLQALCYYTNYIAQPPPATQVQAPRKFFSMDQFYYPSITTTTTSNLNTATTTTTTAAAAAAAANCKPILSWTSSVSALSSSKYHHYQSNNNPYYCN